MDVSNNSNDWSERSLPTEGNNKCLISELCRLCGNCSRTLLSIYEGEGLENNLGKKIEKHLPIRLLENDGLPQSVCLHCASTLLAWHDISENILNVEEKFHKILENMGHVKHVTFNDGNEVTELPALSYSEGKQSSYSKNVPEERLSSTMGEVQRSQEQDRESISPNKMDGKIINASFTLYEHPGGNVQLNDCVEDGIIFSNPVVSSNPSTTVTKTKYYSLIMDKQPESSSYTDPTHEHSLQTIQPLSSVFCVSQNACSKDSHASASVNGEVLSMLMDNSCDTSDSQVKLDHDHDYVLPDTSSSGAIDHDESVTSSCKEIDLLSDQQRARSDHSDKRGYSYTLKIIRNKEKKSRENKARVVVQWLPRRHNEVNCENCKSSFQSVSVLLTHTRFHANQMPFYCKYCGKSYHIYGSLKQHHRQCSNMKKHLEIATDTHHSPDPHRSPDPCCLPDNHHSVNPHDLIDTCHLTDSNHEINSHYVNALCTFNKERNAQFVCELCGKMYKLKYSLKEHLMNHEGKGRLKQKCEKCGAKFPRKIELMEHMKSHDDNMITCELCDKVVLNEKDLESHLISHSDERPHSCNICGLSYKRKSHMTRHRQSHIPTSKKKGTVKSSQMSKQPYKCHLCGKVCRKKFYLEVHMTKHTGARNHECDKCGKRFAQSSALSRHIHVIHRGARDYVCEVCNYKFTAKTTRDNHMRIHTGEKPFQCPQCGKMFRTQQLYKLHEKIHSDVRPFSCHYCSKQFKRRPSLVVHIRTHTGEKPYVCSTCGRGFAQRNDMNKHTKIHRR